MHVCVYVFVCVQLFVCPVNGSFLTLNVVFVNNLTLLTPFLPTEFPHICPSIGKALHIHSHLCDNSDHHSNRAGVEAVGACD